jgi:putative RNA 2'-phosphotransferase
MDKILTDKSKHLSLVLRHKPENIDLILDGNGWGNVTYILDKLNLLQEELDQIVNENNKKRFEFNEDKSKIRARQGHSIDVDVELKKCSPPTILLHGTSQKAYTIIKKQGLKPMNRLHVHMTDSEVVAEQVAKRHEKGKLVILMIAAGQMNAEGHKIYKSNNGVYLTNFVPSKYIMVK